MKMKKTYLGVLMAFALLFVMNARVSATEVSSSDQISTKLSSADDGILEVAAGTFTDDIVIDKNMTIKGAGKGSTVITGKISVSGEVKLTLDGVTLKSDNGQDRIISLTGGASLDVTDSEIYYKNTEATDFGLDSVGIYTEGESTINISSTTIYAKYGVWIKGSNNTVTIGNNSKINGYAAVDITNKGSKVTGNVVTISDSELTGYNIYDPSAGSYGTVVVGSQDGLDLTIENSKLTNSVKTGSKEDLIVISESDSYVASENVTITVAGSELKNTDDSESVIYNLGSTDVVATNALIIINNTTEGTEYSKEDGNIYVTLVTEEGDMVVLFNKSTINESLKLFLQEFSDELAKDEDVVFEGFFKDDEYKEEFNVEDEITEDVKIYMKVSEKKDETVEVPNTFDGVTSYIIMGIISAIMVLGLGYLLNKKLEN